MPIVNFKAIEGVITPEQKRRADHEGLSNLMSGLSGLGWSGIRVVPVDVDAVRGCPVLVDLDEDGGGEAEQGIAVGEDADLAGAAFDLLLDCPLDGVGGTHAPPVRLRQGEDGEAFGDVVLEPVGEAVGRATVGSDEAVEFLLRGLQRGGIPDPPQLGADPLADGDVGGLLNGVLREVKLAALPDVTGQDGAAGGLQPGMVVADDEADAADAAVDQAVEEGSPVDFGFRWIAGDAEHAPSPVRPDADGGEQGGIADHAALAPSRSGRRGRDSG